jgi:hypothetical protein
MKIHYDPMKPTYDPYGEDGSEKGYCGTLLSEEIDNSTRCKNEVTCKKCIKLFENADLEMKGHSESFAKDCQGFVDFMNESKP